LTTRTVVVRLRQTNGGHLELPAERVVEAVLKKILGEAAIADHLNEEPSNRTLAAREQGLDYWPVPSLLEQASPPRPGPNGTATDSSVPALTRITVPLSAKRDKPGAPSFTRGPTQLSQLLAAPNPEAWLFGIARNRALSALRRRRRLGLALARLPRPLERSDQAAEVVALRDLLERHLDPDERTLLLLRYLRGFKAAELAEIVGITPEAVRQRLSRSRRRLIAASDEARHTQEDR
jgi:Sigma-70, region 4